MSLLKIKKNIAIEEGKKSKRDSFVSNLILQIYFKLVRLNFSEEFSF